MNLWAVNALREIPINKPFFGREELAEAMKVIREGSLTGPALEGGKRAREFETMLGRFLGTRYALALNSGTSSLHAAMLALGIGRGDEVLIPSFTFVATANAVAATGARPVFVDIRRSDYTMDPGDLESKVTRRSKAIIPVHLYGHTADMDRISEVAERRSLHVVEDCAQSLGSVYKGRQTGSIGDIGCFSFYASKVLTTGEGGAAVTRSRELAGRIRMIRSRDLPGKGRSVIKRLGLGMPEPSAAIAKAQMRKLPRILRLRRRNATMLTEMLQDLGVDRDLRLPLEPRGSKYNWFLYTVSFRDGDLRNTVLRRLSSSGIHATVYYDPPVHRTPFYDNNASLPNTEWAASHVLSLPVHPHLNSKDMEHMASSLKKALRA